jgi:hypothetical protein
VQLLMSRKSRDGTPAIADHGFQRLYSIDLEAIQMAFVNEVVSEEDIARYNLPFKPGDGRYWTRDKEQDCYLWGGIVENYSREYIPEGRFWLYIRGKLLDISLNLETVYSTSLVTPSTIIWKQVSHIQPMDLDGLDIHEVLSVLRDALRVFGLDGEDSRPSHVPTVVFQF